VAEWLCSGLQSRGRRFDSDPSLHFSTLSGRKNEPLGESPAGSFSNSLEHHASDSVRFGSGWLFGTANPGSIDGTAFVLIRSRQIGPILACK